MRGLRPAVSAAVVSACLMALGCLDAASPSDGRRADLAFYPVFEGYGPLDGTPSDVDSFRITISNPPFRDTVVVRVLTEGQDSIELRVQVTVNAGSDTVTISFQGYSSATGMLLYSGTQSIELRGGIPSPPRPVDATYVGPGRGVRSISIGPDQAALRPGGTQQFTYAAFDTAGVEMPDDSVPVHFVSTNTSVVRVNSAGLATALADGTARIIIGSVARNSIRDTALFTVSAAPPPLVSSVSPANGPLAGGTSVTIT
ncbi:MAG: Ig-like domain-containing protein, partial [Gemmatimonadales bacterium]|nr:Ig-like domain-containing protein [Gemmatimonadales bacterium]